MTRSNDIWEPAVVHHYCDLCQRHYPVTIRIHPNGQVRLDPPIQSHKCKELPA